ncbi:MAG TPA: ABC transporter permease [Candidatus Limnocylindria bacterium]|nr:ABC transporter permease [Candidatus Limnocylindria bacterium]
MRYRSRGSNRLLSYAVRRLLWVIPVLVAASAIAFTVMHAAPGSPWNREGRQLEPYIVEQLNQELGLDQPLPMQYLAWLGRMLTGDMGLSTSVQPFPVGEVIGQAIWPSAQLGLMAFLLAAVIGIPLGAVAALRHRTIVDYAATAFGMLGMVAPAFALAAFLQLFFASSVYRPEDGLFAPGGWEDGPRSWALPTIALAGLPMAQFARYTKASMLDVLHADYVRTAHSKGLDEGRIVTHHMLRNALVPLVTLMGPMLAILITGSIVVERIFDIPGLGNLYWSSIRVRDYSMVMGMTVIYASAVAIINAAVDILYGVIDPRIRDGSVR